MSAKAARKEAGSLGVVQRNRAHLQLTQALGVSMNSGKEHHD